jgi:hypothetical protein
MSLDSNIGTLFDVKKIFFDPVEVMRKAGQANKISLSRIGSYVRQVAKNSIKDVRKVAKKEGGSIFGRVSPPGSPPYSHVGLLKQGILFVYDADRKSVVVGPTLLRDRPKYRDALEMLEYGGTTTRKGKPARYRARPFMGPAMENSAPFDRFWKDSVK